jgi:hypothetical protein
MNQKTSSSEVMLLHGSMKMFFPKMSCKKYGTKGAELQKISYLIDPKNPKSVERALVTIEEHHPGNTIWVE